VRQESEFLWPARGPLTSYFGPYHVLGIDIALDHSEDSPILAAAGGVVEFAGGSACCDYGLHVIVVHDGNRSTLYAHLSQIDVAEGDEVIQGQQLGLGGSTGVSDGKHLHFELRDGDTLVDPLRYLPASERSMQLPLLRNDCSAGFLRVDANSRVLIEFNEAAEFRPVSARFDGESESAGFTAGIEGQGGLTLRVAAAIPPAPSAKGLIRDANLSVTLSDGPNSRTVECGLRVATMVTLANAPRVTRHPGATLTTATPTPLRSKYPTPTPPVKATATPAKPAAGTASQRPSAPPPAATQPKTPPTVKPPQRFPLTQ
jgi:hypothetical protein